MRTRFSMCVGAMAVALATFPTFAASTGGDLNTINDKVLRPLVVQQLERHYDAVHMRVPRIAGRQQLANDTTRMTLWTKVQMPDGTMMDVPESFDVHKMRDHAQAGVYNDLSVYQISRAGTSTPELTIGLSPNNQVVLLNGPTPSEQIPSLR